MIILPPLRRAARVAWNLRMLALFLIGPVAGVIMSGAIFGLPDGLRWAAGGALLISLSLFGMLARGEWRRLSRDRRPGVQ